MPNFPFLLSVSSFLCFVGINGGFTASAVQFDFETLTLSSLKLLGDAHLNNGSVRLTRDLAVPNSGAGRALYSEPIVFRHPHTRSPASFSTFFSFSVTNLNPSSIGGGLAFVISPDGDTVGSAGGFLGLSNPDNVFGFGSGTGSGSGFTAVEFDTLMDVEFKDINGNHVGLDLNAVVSTKVFDLESVQIDLKSGNTVNSWIDYDGSGRVMDISVSYSNIKPKSPILSIKIDLDHYVDDQMFVGFSGSTQGSTEIHNIEWWSFSSSFGSDLENGSSIYPPATADSDLSPPPAQTPTISSAQQNGTKTSSCHNRFCKRNRSFVAGVSAAGALGVAVFAGTLIWICSRKFKKLGNSESFASEIIKSPKEFSYKELKTATKSFDSARIIGRGAFGTVYKGILPETGEILAVKKCSHRSQGKTEFLSELSIIGSLRHRNLVRLHGWCHEKEEILLIYDLMPNGSLDKALFETRFVLPWPHRRKILLGIASALAYLHQECETQVIHRDVKTSNVMLDDAFNAKLGDFGLARQIEHDKSPDATAAAGTMGYLAPEYLLTGRATEKNDVFSFGVVVLEVATGIRPIEEGINDPDRNLKTGVSVTRSSNLVERVWSLYRDGELLAAADKRLEGAFDEDEMRRVLLVGLACSNPKPAARPTMRAVVQMLVGEASAPEVPTIEPPTGFSVSQLLLALQDSVSDCNAVDSPTSSCLSEELRPHMTK